MLKESVLQLLAMTPCCKSTNRGETETETAKTSQTYLESLVKENWKINLNLYFIVHNKTNLVIAFACLSSAARSEEKMEVSYVRLY